MPSKSKAQKKLFDAVAHNPAFASKVGIPQKVGQDFDTADRKAGLNATHEGKPIPHKALKNLPVKKAKGGILGGAGAGSGMGRIRMGRATVARKK